VNGVDWRREDLQKMEGKLTSDQWVAVLGALFGGLVATLGAVLPIIREIRKTRQTVKRHTGKVLKAVEDGTAAAAARDPLNIDPVVKRPGQSYPKPPERPI